MGAPLSSTVKAGRLIRLQGWINLFFTVGLVAAIAIPHIHKKIPMENSDLVLFVAVFLFSIAYLVVGSGVKKYKNWAKISGVALVVLALPNFPIGTVVGGIALFYLVRGWSEPVPQ